MEQALNARIFHGCLVSALPFTFANVQNNLFCFESQVTDFRHTLDDLVIKSVIQLSYWK